MSKVKVSRIDSCSQIPWAPIEKPLRAADSALDLLQRKWFDAGADASPPNLSLSCQRR
jgi:hypothetical protein